MLTNPRDAFRGHSRNKGHVNNTGFTVVVLIQYRLWQTASQPHCRSYYHAYNVAQVKTRSTGLPDGQQSFKIFKYTVTLKPGLGVTQGHQKL